MIFDIEYSNGKFKVNNFRKNINLLYLDSQNPKFTVSEKDYLKNNGVEFINLYILTSSPSKLGEFSVENLPTSDINPSPNNDDRIQNWVIIAIFILIVIMIIAIIIYYFYNRSNYVLIIPHKNPLLSKLLINNN
jgi:ATP-dependent Zn protease